MMDPIQRQQALAELERRKSGELGRYYVPNGRIEQFLQAIGMRFKPWVEKNGVMVRNPRIYICILRAGNSLGKSCLAANLAGYMSSEYSNPYFDAVPYLKEMKRPNSGRIITTATAAEENYDREFLKWLPRGRYKASKGGRNFNSDYKFDSGSDFDVMTFNQDPEEGESVLKNWAIIDEPMSKAHYKALKARFRFGGIIFWIMTPLKGAEWCEDEFETVERLTDDVLLMTASSEDNCIEHGVRGIIPHESLEDQWRDFDEDDISARRDGVYLTRGGTIYKTFRDDYAGHILPVLPPYYQECWDKGLFTLWQTIDPHDRKPWIIEWRACFPNGKDIGIAEWPDESMKPFHKIKSWNYGYDAYAQLTIATEKALGRNAYATIMDPNYGPSAAMTADGVTSIGAEFKAALKRGKLMNRRMIFPSDAITPGHMLVKAALGDPAKGVTPNSYWLEHERNARFSMTHYGYKENKDESKGLSEVPILQHKDGADLIRYFKSAKARYIQTGENGGNDVTFYTPKKYGNGRVGV